MSLRRIREFLDGHKAKYAIIEHSPAFTAQEVAQSAHIPGKDMAKTVVVIMDGKLAMAVVPAPREVDMGGLRAAAGARHVELAAESDFVDRFEGCQLALRLPFGNLFGMETYVDKSLIDSDYIAFNAGTHTEVIAMRFADYRRLVHPKLAYFSLTVTDMPHDVCMLQV